MVQEEKLYSTVLDNLLERAFCEGYELAQREFGARDIKKARAIARQVRVPRQQQIKQQKNRPEFKKE